MPQHAALEEEMQFLWDEANLLVLAAPFDREAAINSERKLRDCSKRARALHRAFGATQLERMATALAAMIRVADSTGST